MSVPSDGRPAHPDLRGGRPPWHAPDRLAAWPPLPESRSADVVVVGGGITGSLVAYELTRAGHRVVVLDRRRPGTGSTAASTAMLMWEIDQTLTALADTYGLATATGVYRQSMDALQELVALAGTLSAPVGLARHASLYLAGPQGLEPLHTEHRVRRRAGLPGELLDAAGLRETFAFDRPGAIWSPGAATVDPVRLAAAVLHSAVQDGAAVYEADVVAYDDGIGGVSAYCAGGPVVDAAACVLATGYDLPPFVRTDLHSITSTWAVATVEQEPGRRWRDDVLLWENAEPYLYARTTPGGRIIAGGGDSEAADDPADRDRLIPAKADIILAKLRELRPSLSDRVAYAWAGDFGTTVDGLPLIGEVPGHHRMYAAYGYGGNGITYSYLAARLLTRMIGGRRPASADWYALDRQPGNLLV